MQARSRLALGIRAREPHTVRNPVESREFRFMHQPNEMRLRGVILLTILAGAVFVTLPLISWWHRLPPDMVVRWDVPLQPAFALSKSTYLVAYLGLYTLCTVVAVSGKRNQNPTSGTLAALTLIGGILGSITWYTAWTQIDTTSWHEAGELSLCCPSCWRCWCTRSQRAFAKDGRAARPTSLRNKVQTPPTEPPFLAWSPSPK
jgi:hypothetical protein